MIRGRTISLYGDSGAGKTTLGGEYAKHKFKTEGLRTYLNSADLGGADSIQPLINLDVVRIATPGVDDDPFVWINNAVSRPRQPEEGCRIFDSGTSMGEALLQQVRKSNWKVGTQATQKFKVAENLSVEANNQAHYGIVQSFLLEMMWKSTWIANEGVDVIWTFAVERGENEENIPIVGPKVAGKALTAAMPKWFKYTFRVVSIPVAGSAPRHVLYIQEQPGENGLAVSFGNARYPLDADTLLPATIEPASLVEALRLIENGQEEAQANIARELGIEL